APRPDAPPLCRALPGGRPAATTGLSPAGPSTAGGATVVVGAAVVVDAPVVTGDGARVAGGVLRGAFTKLPGGRDEPAPWAPAAGAGVAGKPTAAAVSRRPWQPCPQGILAAVSRMRCTAAAALRPSARRRATVPVTCGLAIDVPWAKPYLLPGNVERTHRPCCSASLQSAWLVSSPPGATRPHWALPSELE